MNNSFYSYLSYLDYSTLYYFIIVIPIFILSLFAQIRVKSSFRKYSKVMSSRNLTGAKAAMRILKYYGINNVSIEKIPGKLSDHYDPKANVIRLSEDVCDSTSVAAIGVACHEAGHAAQYAENYSPIILRNKLVTVCNIGSRIGLPLAILGFFLGIQPLVLAGIILYSLIAVFQIVTLPVEFDASKRALSVIGSTDILTEEESKGAKRVLWAAAMTYVASLALVLANIFRFLLLFLGGGRGRR